MEFNRTEYSFGSEKSLLQRIRWAIEKKEKLIFLIGSGLTCSLENPYNPGVMNVSQIVDEINRTLQKQGALEIFNEEISKSTNENSYQVAMRTLLMCAGQDELNKIITNAVLSARLNNETTIQTESIDQQALENNTSIWNIRMGLDSIAKLHLAYKATFPGPILTTNFDPLIEIAIRKNGGKAHTVTLTNDGAFDNIITNESIGVVHFHGFWHGSDTLHTNDQITKQRPLLKGALKKLLNNHSLVVMGYGGWNDVLTRSLIEVAEEGGNFKNILWTFFTSEDDKILSNYKYILQGFRSTINQRVVLYKGINADAVLSQIGFPGSANLSLSDVVSSKRSNINLQTESPPVYETWTGRETEISQLERTSAKVIFITGIGGQGKTALASYYIREKFDNSKWELWDWRDCKEESNRLHTKLLSIIEFLSNGKIRAFEIHDETIQNLIELLFDTLGQRRIIFVFDNVDQYIDLEKFHPSGPLEILYQSILSKDHNSKFIFTCRPEIRIVAGSVDLIPLPGFSYETTEDLFLKNGFDVSGPKLRQLIIDSHNLTDGHPLMLNIIIGQLKKEMDAGLKFVNDIKEDKNTHTLSVAERTLKSVWLTLNTKQQILLRGIAENIKPESEQTLLKVLESELNYNQFSKALRALRSLNLIVVREQLNQKELIDLHPLVKQFIRNKYPKNERSKYITLFVEYYNNLLVVTKKTLSVDTPLSIFEDWTSKIELEIAKDDYKSALVSLHEIEGPILISGYHEEYLRVLSKLFLNINWRSAILEEYRYFHEEFREFIDLSIHMGRVDIDYFLKQYVDLIPGKGVQYLSYCDMQCYYNWFTANFDVAIEWGQRGMHLKESSKIDSSVNLEHNLNLAYRDSGEKNNIEKALKYFLDDAKLEDVLLFSKPEGRIHGTYFGNVGRCFDLLQDKDLALKCYKKSFLFLLESRDFSIPLNIGFAAIWIADILYERKDLLAAFKFYKYAHNTWEKTSKYKAQKVNNKILELSSNRTIDEKQLKTSDFEIERFCRSFASSN